MARVTVSTRITTYRRGPTPTTGDTIGAANLARRIGQRLREDRHARGISLDDLSRASGVSRAALSQIETCKTSPSISVMWKIAVGLGIPFAELLGGRDDACTLIRSGDSQPLRSLDGHLESRPIMPAGTTPWVEVYELKLAAGTTHRADAHAPGTRELMIALSGSLQIAVGRALYDLAPGDSLAFRADQPHSYGNPGAVDAHAHNVIIYHRT
jgi:transcriptional regulator with XRE-family HTH domain